MFSLIPLSLNPGCAEDAMIFEPIYLANWFSLGHRSSFSFIQVARPRPNPFADLVKPPWMRKQSYNSPCHWVLASFDEADDDDDDVDHQHPQH